MSEEIDQPLDGVEEDVQEEILEEEGEDLETEQPEPEPEEEEVEHEGKKYRIPKELKPALMMQADYTRKTQELAELRRAVEAEKTQVTQTNQAVMQGRARLLALDETLQQYSKLDWNALQQQDPQEAQSQFMRWQQMKDTRQQLAGDLYAVEQKQALEQQQILAKQVEEGNAVLMREIPGWGVEVQAKLRDFAGEFGYSKEELANVTDPRAIKLLYAAYTAKQAKPIIKKPPPQEIKPVKQVGTGSSPVVKKDPSKMTDAEFAAWRRSQIKKRK